MSAHTASKLASQLRTTEGASVSDFVMEPEANGGEERQATCIVLQRERVSTCIYESIDRPGGEYPIDFLLGQ